MLSEEMAARGRAPSCIRELYEYGLRQAKRIGRENVYDYSLGNPSIPPPPEVGEAIEALLSEESGLRLHGYTSANGAEDARVAIAADLHARFGVPVSTSDLFLTCGAAPAVLSALHALAVPDFEVVVLAPFFPEYRVYVSGSGAKLRIAAPDVPRFQIRTDEVERQLNPHTQAVIVNSPNNPSGAVYSRETLEALAALLTKKSAEYGHPIYIVADEPYRELVYDHAEAPFIPTVYANTVVCYSYSKSLSLPGERIGYVYVPEGAADSEALMAAITGSARTIGHVCAPSLMQRVVARCAGVRPDIAAYDRNRTLLYRSLTEYGYRCAKPEGAFYLFIEAPGGSARAFSERAKAENLLLVPGDDFGCPDYFRICTCVAYDMIQRSLPVFERLIRQTQG